MLHQKKTQNAKHKQMHKTYNLNLNQQQAYAKASKALGLIARTLSHKNQDILLKLYKTLVRPHLEYCVSVWSPYYEKDKILLERVQHRFTWLIPGFKQLTYMERLRRLRLWTLEERRNRAELLEVFRIFRGQSLISFTDLFTISTVTNTRGHSAKLTKHRYFFWACGWQMEQLTTRRHWCRQFEYFQKWIGSCAKYKDGLLHGLVGLLSLMASFVLWSRCGRT